METPHELAATQLEFFWYLPPMPAALAQWRFTVSEKLDWWQALLFCRGQKPPATSSWRQLPPCREDSIVSLQTLGCATRRHRPSPPPTLLPELRPAPPWVPGESRAHLEPQAPGGLGREVAAFPAHSWWRAPSRIPLSKEARSSA